MKVRALRMHKLVASEQPLKPKDMKQIRDRIGKIGQNADDKRKQDD